MKQKPIKRCWDKECNGIVEYPKRGEFGRCKKCGRKYRFDEFGAVPCDTSLW